MALDPLARRSRRFAVSSDWGWDGVVHALRGVWRVRRPVGGNPAGCIFRSASGGLVPYFWMHSYLEEKRAAFIECHMQRMQHPKSRFGKWEAQYGFGACVFRKKRTGWLEAGTRHLTVFVWWFLGALLSRLCSGLFN